MSSNVRVDLASPIPPFEQIRSQIVSLIGLGELPDGARLPTVRALATDLGVAAGTVARAYKELEASGMMASRRRAGTVVASPPTVPATGGGLVQAVDELLELARREGVDQQTLIALVERRSGQRAGHKPS